MPRDSPYRFVIGSIIIAVAVVGGFTIANLGTISAPIPVGFLTDVTGPYLPGPIFWALASSTLFLGGLGLSREIKRG